MADIAYIQSKLRSFPDFPKKGINFCDIFPIFRDPLAFEYLISHIVNHIATTGPPPTVVVGLDARGFLIGPLVAQRLQASFAPVRKKGKLPGETVVAKYEKEYGVDEFEMQSDAINKGDKVVVIDDLIATGGSAKAAADLITKLGGQVQEYVFIVELTGLNGKQHLNAPVYSLIKADD